jgi:hypothetical protein
MKTIYEKYTTIISPPPKHKILSTGPQKPKYIRCADKEQLEKFRTSTCNSEFSRDNGDDDDNNNNNNNNNNNAFFV